jgi:hypothetical protein
MNPPVNPQYNEQATELARSILQYCDPKLVDGSTHDAKESLLAARILPLLEAGYSVELDAPGQGVFIVEPHGDVMNAAEFRGQLRETVELLQRLTAPAETAPGAVALTDRERGTVLAALRYYQEQGLADDPQRRSDAIHDIATDGDTIMSSLCGIEIDALCERLNPCTIKQTPALRRLPSPGVGLTALPAPDKQNGMAAGRRG